MVKILGYLVEKNDSKFIPFILHGPKGARIGLVRNQKVSGVLFSINLNSKNFPRIERVKGCQYFSDKGGSNLGPISDECFLRLS